MSEEVELVAKTIGESIEPLAEASGLLGPIKELSDWVSSFIHYRRMPTLARQVHRAAERIREAGLPPAAVPDQLLRDLLEGGSLADDESLQERWANLLANAVTASEATVHPAFSDILRQLQPDEARALDAVADQRWATPWDSSDLARDNLRRLGLIELIEGESMEPFAYSSSTKTAITELGRTFVAACRAPVPPSGDSDRDR